MARRTKVDVEVTDGSSAERFRFAELSMRGALRSAAGLAREDFCPLPLIPGQAPQLADWVGARPPPSPQQLLRYRSIVLFSTAMHQLATRDPGRSDRHRPAFEVAPCLR